MVAVPSFSVLTTEYTIVKVVYYSLNTPLDVYYMLSTLKLSTNYFTFSAIDILRVIFYTELNLITFAMMEYSRSIVPVL